MLLKWLFTGRRRIVEQETLSEEQIKQELRNRMQEQDKRLRLIQARADVEGRFFKESGK